MRLPNKSLTTICRAGKNSVVSPLSVVPLKIGKNNCKPGETYRKTPSFCKIPTLYRANFAEDRHQHFRGGLSKINPIKKIPAASRRGILDAFEKSLAKLNSIFAPRGGVLDPKLHNKPMISMNYVYKNSGITKSSKKSHVMSIS